MDKIKKALEFCRQHPLLTTLTAIFIVGWIIIWLLMVFLDVWTHHGDDSTVPAVKHLTYEEARRRAMAADLEIEISDSIYDTSLPPGTIVESWPKEGSQVKRGRKIYVTLTSFTPKHVTISMPITGVSSRQAISYLNAMGITGVRIVNVHSQFPGLVEGAHSDGRPIGVGSVIPVDANVVLEVGFAAPSEDDELNDEDSESAEDAIFSDLAGSLSSNVDE